MERRKFLQSAGAGSLASLAAKSAPKVIRAGILGSQHSHTLGKIQAMKDAPENYEVVGIAEPDPAARDRAQKNTRFEGLKWMPEEQLLSDPSINLIVAECWVWEAISRGQKVIAAGKH